MLALIDTNVLVYRFDPRFPDKQHRATELLREGLTSGLARVPYQAILEFVAATTKERPSGPLLTSTDARREAEDLLDQFDVLYPDEDTVRTAIRGAATYQLAWFDAHIWACAEVSGIPLLYSEDFGGGRRYGKVRIIDPFA